MFNLEDVLKKLQASLEQKELDEAIRLIESLRSADQAELFAELDDEDQTDLLPRLDPSDSADIMENLDDQDRADLASTLSSETVARIMDEMEPDEAADLLGDLSPQQARDVLSQLEDPEEVRPLLFHHDDSAGGLMTSEFLALRPRMKASEAIEALRLWSPQAEAIYYLFVVDQDKKLCGVVSLRNLITALPETPISEIMNPDRKSVV